MAKRKEQRHRLELILAGLGACTLPFLPRFMILWMANGLAALGCLVARRDCKIADANLVCAFADSLTAAQRRKIIRGSMRSFAILMLDLFWFHRFSERRVRRYVLFDDSAKHYFENKPAIVATAHFGNWEVGAQATGYRNEPLVSIAAEIGSPAMNRLLVNLRQKSGQTITTQRGAVRALLKVLRSGQRTALLLDQNTLPADGGVFVDFLGLPAPMSSAASMLSSHTNAPIVISYCITQPNGYYRLYALEPFVVTEQNKAHATQDIADQLSAMIRRHPDQWLWMYKRWKYIPQGHDGNGYPFYARKMG